MGSPAAHLGRVCIRQATRGLSQFSHSENGTVPLCNPRITPYDAVCIVLGLILLTAAALKGHQLATEPVAETSLFSSRWLLIGVVEFELFFGLWLLSGLYPRRTRQAALVCFSAFACVSFYKALSGEATCGCFGRVPVNPWYTLLLDLAAVAALLLCRPARRAETSPLPLSGEGPGVRARASLLPLAAEGPGVRAGAGARPACIFGLFLVAGIPAALAMGTYRAATLDDSGDIFGDSEFVVLEPETWIDRPFPLLKYVDVGDRLTEGEWIVVMYHHECPSCQEAIRHYKREAISLASASDSRRIALIEVPPYHGHRAASDRHCLAGRLADVRHWLVSTPVEIELHHGIVARVSNSDVDEQIRRASLLLERHHPRIRMAQDLTGARFLVRESAPVEGVTQGIGQGLPATLTR